MGDSSDVEVQVVDEPDEDPTPSTELTRVQELLAQLRGPVAIQLFRKKPTWCAGFLDEVILSEGEELDLRQLKEDWGGGTIQLRPRVFTSGGTKWAKGGGMVTFTGPPRERGREINPDGYAKNGSAALVVETRPAPVKSVADQGPYQIMGMMFQGMMTMMTSILQQQQQQRPVISPATNPLGALGEQLAIFKKLQQTFEPETDEEDEEAPVTPLERLIKLGMEAYEKKEEKKQSPESKGFRLHKANPEAPAANQKAKPTPQELLEVLKSLPEDQQMEILGTLSNDIPPEIVKAWMTQNFGGKTVAG